jgi:hypothetical protein
MPDVVLNRIDLPSRSASHSPTVVRLLNSIGATYAIVHSDQEESTTTDERHFVRLVRS